ncbi:heavy metal-binding domain-containing protein [Shewanella sp.]|uniref:heavy metal-binding domain-containing protein n=1 Tax=Shewanella sp. TaxID=50422 RepID=UPI001ECF5714|nr:heavy metal-binding domain-containing protein [Shewanella sp.]NRB22254.1 ATPase P [Shewanella sp.]
MKTLISLILSAFFLISLVPAVSAHDHSQPQEHAQHHEMKADHACPMHPEVTGEKGDTYPKCGMNLTAAQGAPTDTHACPMNPSITGKEGDTCPKCGMHLVPMQAKADTKTAVHHKH